MISLYNGILQRHEKEYNSATCHSNRHKVKLKKPDTKEYMCITLFYIKFIKGKIMVTDIIRVATLGKND